MMIDPSEACCTTLINLILFTPGCCRCHCCCCPRRRIQDPPPQPQGRHCLRWCMCTLRNQWRRTNTGCCCCCACCNPCLQAWYVRMLLRSTRQINLKKITYFKLDITCLNCFFVSSALIHIFILLILFLLFYSSSCLKVFNLHGNIFSCMSS